MMNETSNDIPLADEFPKATRDDWLKLVTGVLKGADFDKRLVSRTADGLRIAPLYPRAEAASPIAGRSPMAPWQVMQRVDHPDAGVANADALHDLENGATGLSLVFAGSVGAYGYGLDASEQTLSRALDGIYLDAGITIALDLSPQTKEAGPSLAALVRQRGIAPDATDIRFGFDPIGALAVAGGGPMAWRDIAPIFSRLVTELAGQGFKGPFAAADGRPIHAAGGSEAQELAFVLATGVTYLRALEAGGVSLDQARRMVFFRLAADADQFLTMAKFRALRKLWARVEEACGLAPTSAFIAAETAWRMMTQRDPWVNMLRTTIAAFAAGLSGANAITVLPFTMALGLPDRFARRVARNAQLILLEESSLAKVSDPAAGSGGIEDLTDQLCVAAWSLFQEIETTGGIAAALESGLIQGKVAAARKERETAVALRRAGLTGVSEFPNLREAPVAVLDVSRVTSSSSVAPAWEPLSQMRLAEPFERLRDASDRLLATSGSRPRAFLATLGTPAEFTARAMFAKNFFEAGGIEAGLNDGFAGTSAAAGESHTDLAALVAAFKASGATLACLCASDEVYAREAAEAARALAASGAAPIYLAGRPKADDPTLAEAGVETFIYTGCDALATLVRTHAMFGLK